MYYYLFNYIINESIIDYNLYLDIKDTRSSIKNEKLKQELAEENKKALYEIEVVQDKVKYLDEITNSKKQMAKQIKQIDETINNEKLLEKELEKRRKKMGKKSQLLNKQYLKALLSDERRKIIEKILKTPSMTYLKHFIFLKKYVNLDL